MKNLEKVIDGFFLGIGFSAAIYFVLAIYGMFFS